MAIMATVVIFAVGCIVGVVATKMKKPEWLERVLSNSSVEVTDIAGMEDVCDPVVLFEKIRNSVSVLNNQASEQETKLEFGHQYIACFFFLVHQYRIFRTKHPEIQNQDYEKTCEEDVPVEELEKIFNAHILDFAVWAYDVSSRELRGKLKNIGYTLLRHDTSSEPGRVAHFLALNENTKQFVISVRGTSSMEDVLTDVLSVPVVFKLDDSTSCNMHEGVKIAAETLAEETIPLIHDLVFPAGYKVLLTGHSLGAATAAALAIVLRAKIPDLHLRAVVFEPPPTVDVNMGLECSSFITSVVNNDDAICRFNLPNLVNLKYVLSTVYNKMEEKGMEPSTLSQLLKQKKFMKGDKLLDTIESLQEDRSKIMVNAEKGKSSVLNLIVPGRVIFLYRKSYYDVPSKEDNPNVVGLECKYCKGTAQPLSMFMPSSGMMTDHFISTVRINLEAFLKQKREIHGE